MSDLIFVKLGGSLVTDKRTPQRARPEVIERLGAELGNLAARLPGGVVLGHGSGSFGHTAALRHQLSGKLDSEGQIDGVAVTRGRATQLNRLVVDALLAGGARPFSFPPSSWMMAAAGRPRSLSPEPILHGLRLGLLPVVYGDVVMDREWGAAICSTETVFLALARALRRRGRKVSRAFWLGETDGIYGPDGTTVPQLTSGSPAGLLRSVGGAEGDDVTGGMRHRLRIALALARLGVASWIGDGRRAGVLERAVAGEESSGTWVLPAPPTGATER